MTVSYLVQERPLVLRSDAHNNMFLVFTHSSTATVTGDRTGLSFMKANSFTELIQNKSEYLR